MEVTVYSKDNCGQCLGVKMFLGSKGIDFQEKNTSHKEEYLSELEVSSSELPVIFITDKGKNTSEPVIGFDPERLTKLFGKLG